MRDLHSPSLLGRQECSAIRHQRGVKKWPLELIPPQPFRLFRPAHIYLCHPALKWRARPVLPRLGLARQASIDAVQTHAHKWPARVTRPVLSLKRRLHHFNACRPKVLQLGAAQVPAGYRPAALLVSYRRLNWWFAPSRAKLAPLVGLAPTDTGLKGQPHDGLAFRGINWLLGLDSHQDLFA